MAAGCLCINTNFIANGESIKWQVDDNYLQQSKFAPKLRFVAITNSLARPERENLLLVDGQNSSSLRCQQVTSFIKIMEPHFLVRKWSLMRLTSFDASVAMPQKWVSRLSEQERDGFESPRGHFSALVDWLFVMMTFSFLINRDELGDRSKGNEAI